MNFDSQIKSFYEKQFGKEFKAGRLAELRIEKTLSLIGSGKRVLDVGCCDGSITLRIKKLGNEVVGIDISEKAVRRARKKGLEVYVVDLNNEAIPKNLGKFDVVVAAEILEHIFDTDGFLKKLRDVLKPQGYLILTTPNLAGIGARLQLLFGRKPWMIEDSIKGNVSGHIRYFTLATLVGILQRNGFKVTRITSDSVGLGSNLVIPFLNNLFPQFGRILIVKAEKR